MPALTPPDPPLTDGVVTLRAWRDTDAGAIVRMMDEPEIARWTRAPSPYKESDAIAWLATHPVLLRRRTELPLAITSTDSGELIGSIGLRFPEDGRGEFGYLVAAGARRRGIAARALRLYARYAFDELDVKRLEVQIQPANEASLGLAESVGFRREGTLRSYTVVRGQRVDLVMLSMLPDELRS